MSDTLAQPHTVFVSHAHADNELCDRYVDALKQSRLDVWYDRSNLQGGQRLGKEIERELEQRTALVVLLTPASIASYWVDMEVAAFRDLAAYDASRLLIPVRIADCTVPLLMRGLFWIDAVALGFDIAIDALAQSLLANAGVTPTDAALPIAGHHSTPVQKMIGPSERDRYNEILGNLERKLAADPHDASAWKGKGIALRKLGRDDKALAAFERALSIYEQALKVNPNNADLWSTIGDVLGTLMAYEQAESAYRRARELREASESAVGDDATHPTLDPASTAVSPHAETTSAETVSSLIEHANELYDQERWTEAAEVYNQVLAIDPDNKDIWIRKGWVLSILGATTRS